jgi:hypothetical protein
MKSKNFQVEMDLLYQQQFVINIKFKSSIFHLLRYTSLKSAIFKDTN